MSGFPLNNHATLSTIHKFLSLRVLSIAAWVIAGSLLSACGDNPQSQPNPGTINNQGNVVNEPAITNPDVQQFKLTFWDPLKGEDRCGRCHGTNGQSPTFVNGDVNTAHSYAITVVDLATPANSRVVQKVLQGHNCWVNDVQVCADIIEQYIVNWAGGNQDTSGRQITLTAPAIKDPGHSRNFPTTAQSNGGNSFSTTVYPLLRTHCQACHAEDAATPQSPFFANADVNTAYLAAKAKMDLDTPANSRFVLRLGQEYHNCWTTTANGCVEDASDMQAAITAFSGAIPLTEIDPALITSKALNFGDAIIASGGSRYENNVIALWEFKTGTGNTAYDTSGVNPALNLTFNGAVDWVLGYGVEIINGKAQGSTANSKKLYDFIHASGEYSIESWVVPGNVTQEGSSIITYSGGSAVRNFTMGQTMYNYDFYNHTNLTDGTENSKLMTADAAERLQASLQHVVMTFDPVNGRRIYVNGEDTGDRDNAGEQGGNLAAWSDNFAFVLGNEPSSAAATLWKGKLRLVAIHNRALTLAQIQQNFNVGVGQKYYMLFSIADRIGVPDSYILFEVEQYDNYAYLFIAPRFINLDPNWVPSGPIPIKGIRLGINGKEAVSGQAYGNLDAVVTPADYTSDGQVLSNLGTVIALEKGPESDEFFLTFEQLGSSTHLHAETVPVAPQGPADAEAVSDIGVRTFDEINATMSEVTGVPVTNSEVSATFNQYRRQFPAVEDIQAYLASHQMAVAQLAMKYCDVLVDSAGAPSYFTGFDFNQTAAVAFDTQTKRDQIITPLMQSIMNVGTNTPATQPVATDISSSLSSFNVQSLDSYGSYNSIMDCMTRCARGLPMCTIAGVTPSCGSTNQNTTMRTKEVVKASCTALLGSAVMLIQ